MPLIGGVMSKVIVAFGSFIVGACSMFIALSLIHTSTRVHAQAAPSSGIVAPAAEPTVPSGPIFRFEGGALGGDIQQLDGIVCNGCAIGARTVTYAGGVFSC